MIVRTDCRHYRGDVPCRPHKEGGVHCEDCKHYDRVDKKILIIKLGAIGDVIRTTPLVRKLKEVYPACEIYWLTNYPEILPSMVDHRLGLELKNVLTLEGINFDVLYNLDKDKEACSLTNRISAITKKGFKLENGKCFPINEEAKHKWLTGIFDDINRANRKSYLEEIFEICGFTFDKERYILDRPKSPRNWELNKEGHVVGLNTGCGSRWTTRLWPVENWVELAKRLMQQGCEVVLLGGPDEDERNRIIAQECHAKYFGHFALSHFIDLVDQCDVVVSAVTMVLHIAVGLEKKIVLFNNIFNKYEFELYGLGEILEPDVPCKGCYKAAYDSNCPAICMEMITVDKVFQTCSELWNRSEAAYSK